MLWNNSRSNLWVFESIFHWNLIFRQYTISIICTMYLTRMILRYKNYPSNTKKWKLYHEFRLDESICCYSSLVIIFGVLSASSFYWRLNTQFVIHTIHTLIYCIFSMKKDWGSLSLKILYQEFEYSFLIRPQTFYNFG